ncbi:MAG: ABC transporter substrate-binding protein [Candidatus Rokubacteria bacterium]|nr:ABC transporter substrate-binding protein [Candidatus Rokubacteria bacterium]
MRGGVAPVIVFLALGLLVAPLPADAQQPGKMYRVGLIFTTSPVSEMAGPEPVHPLARAFLHTLGSLGYVEGQNLVFERRSAEGKFERFTEIVAELVRLKTDVIVTAGVPTAQAAKQVTTTVPIVMATSDSPIEAGLVASLARPGGNITGLTINTGPEIEGKRLELLKDALPKISRVAYLGMKTDWEGSLGEGVKAAAKGLNVTLLHAEHTPNEYAGAFTLIARQRPDALFVPNSAPAFANRRLIVEFAVKNRLPGTSPWREFVEAGGLMSYGVSLSDLFRRAAVFVDKILKGAKPADLPVEQPTKFELVINLKTAKSLGLTIPPSVLVRADEVIR